MLTKRIHVNGANVLVMGLSFKENCPDLRNSKVVDIISELKEYNINVDVADPWCSKEEALDKYDIKLCEENKQSHYDAIILAVAHNEFKDMGIEAIRAQGKEKTYFIRFKIYFG